jgi:hypothetical protein
MCVIRGLIARHANNKTPPPQLDSHGLWIFGLFLDLLAGCQLGLQKPHAPHLSLRFFRHWNGGRHLVNGGVLGEIFCDQKEISTR